MIVGITGTYGAGKGAVVDILKEKGFKHYSCRGFIAEYIEDEGNIPDREHLIEMGNRLRKQHSPSFVAEQCYIRAQDKGGDAVIESLRTPGEVEALRKKGDFVFLAVDAPIDVRYQRITGRGTHTDDVSFEEFKRQEEVEKYSEDPAKLNLSACFKMADHVIVNDGTFEDLREKVEDIFGDDDG